MALSWILTTDKLEQQGSLYKQEYSNFTLFSSSPAQRISDSELIECLIEGCVMPTLEAENKFQSFVDIRLISALYRDYGLDFIQYVKGEFNLILCHQSGFSLYSDHLGMKKFFYYDNEVFTAANNLSLIPEKHRATIDIDSVKLNSLFYHFVSNRTFIKGIKYNRNAHRVELTKTGIKHSSYWEYNQLYAEKSNLNINQISEIFQKIIVQQLTLFPVNKPSITLTGGVDSRLVLAVLLKHGVKPIVCTYGNPESRDVSISKQLCTEYHLPFFNPNITNPDVAWFKGLSKDTLLDSNSLSSVYRAYRYDALKQFKMESDADTLFTGFVGGEGIRGYEGNGYYECGILQDLVQNKEYIADLFDKYSKTTYWKFSSADTDLVSHLDFIHPNDINTSTFEYLYGVIARLHHGADIQLFSNIFNHVVNPYLDIDYLQALHSSRRSFLGTQSGIMRKYNNFHFYSSMIDSISPKLLEPPLSNGYSLRTFKSNRLLFLWQLVKRKKVRKAVLGFTYGSWFADYIKSIDVNRLPHSVLSHIDTSQLSSELKQVHRQNEGYWQKFTNVTTIAELYNEYLASDIGSERSR